MWSDGETMWFGVSCWRALAENVAASVSKGDKVVVSGRLTVSTWTTEKGEQRSGLEIVNPTVGFDLSRGTAVLHKNPPLTITSDPGYPVDTVTGEVLEDHDATQGGGKPTLLVVPNKDDLIEGVLEPVDDREVVADIHLGRFVYDQILHRSNESN